MGLFSRKPRARFPADILQWLETFGRYELDPQRSGIAERAGSSLWDRLGPFLEMAKQDTDGFFGELRTVVAADRGGFATYGASRLAWELLGTECLRTPAALPLIDAGIEFKLASGYSSMMLTGYESQRLAETRRLSEREG